MDFSNAINLNKLSTASTETLATMGGYVALLVGIILAFSIISILLNVTDTEKEKEELKDDKDDDII